MRPAEYSSLQRAADGASLSAQKTFLWLNIVQLWILSLNALIAGWNPPDPAAQRKVAIAVCVLMFIALMIASALKVGKFDDKWFRARAYAENIKIAAWLFVTGRLDEAGFLEKINELNERLPEFAKAVALYHDGGPNITEWMREARKLALPERVALYRSQRLDDQLNWYHSKSTFNARKERNWFVALFIIEFVAFGYAVVQAWLMWEFNAVGGVAAASAAFIAWMQTKRFSDLGLSYQIAAADLHGIGEKYRDIASEDAFGEMVKESEAAISREHTVWLSRRTAV